MFLNKTLNQRPLTLPRLSVAAASGRSTAAPPPGRRRRCAAWGETDTVEELKMSNNRKTVWQRGRAPAHQEGARGNRVFICYRRRVGTVCQDPPLLGRGAGEGGLPPGAALWQTSERQTASQTSAFAPVHTQSGPSPPASSRAVSDTSVDLFNGACAH